MTLEKIPKFDEVKTWAQNQGWITENEAPVQSVNSQTGNVEVETYTDSDAQSALENTSPTFETVTATVAKANATYATLDDVPSDLPAGAQVYVEEDSRLYIEDGI